MAQLFRQTHFNKAQARSYMSQIVQNQVAIWAGIECTINRVGDAYQDQLEYSGHYQRGTADLEAIAQLGIKKLRYPIPWERHEPQKGIVPDWAFARAGLEKLTELGVIPIVGLVHHGSGPAWVSFMDGSFEEGLKAYARLVAEQFPWVAYYTPVNEPLTTARFCGMYGHWYPHGRSTDAFARILVSECKATILAMEAIREINPNAKLIQTEDLGRTYSTPLLQYQAELENRWRWLSVDLIAGRVSVAHPMWQYLIDAGIPGEELQFFVDRGALPDVIGLNYYITSERYIDEAQEHYPVHTHGGNEIHQYADIEAVSVALDEPTGMELLLRDAWNRYKHPIAITEVHLGGSREQQARWLHKIWMLSNSLRHEGMDIRAITAWAALGLYGWNELCRYPRGLYEPGLFDVRSGQPRSTALALLVRQLCTDGDCGHPAVAGCVGWWEKPARWKFRASQTRLLPAPADLAASQKPLLILGKTGTLGKAFARICCERDIHHVLWGREELDITRQDSMEEKIAALNPWAIVNATGYVRVNDAEAQSEQCYLINCTGAVALAKAAAELSIPLLGFSSDLVFDGRKGNAYTERDCVNPINVYGRSKADAEEGIFKHHSCALVIRTSSFFGPWDDHNFISLLLQQLSENKPFAAAADVIVSPTYVPDLVSECLDLLLDDASGIWHITNGHALSWAEFARQAAERGGFDSSLIAASSQNELSWKARYPENSALNSERGVTLPSIHHALDRYLQSTKHIRGGKALVNIRA